MKTEDRELISQSAGITAVEQMGIEAQDMPFVAEVLRSGLYANKPLAILREYACNGHDSHVEAGWPHKPIQVKLPSALDPVLEIRDFGTGLSHEDTLRVFAHYGRSTKRGTNEQTGQLGIGSKSAFCYTDSYQITSFFNGVVNVYDAHIDESNIGVVTRIVDNEPTDEENGILISLRVNVRDVQTFASTAQDFFKHFEPKPIILNNDDVHEAVQNFEQESIMLSKDGDWKITKDSNYHYQSNPTKVYVRMGNIVYPVDIHQVADKYHPKQKWVFTGGMSLFIYAKIGDVAFVSSREALQYDSKGKTRDFIASKLEAIFDEIQTGIEAEIASAPNIWEARKILKSRKSDLGFISFTPRYNGKEIAGLTVSDKLVKDNKVTVKRQDSNRRYSDGYAIEPGDKTTLFIHRADQMSEIGGKARARQYMNANGVAYGDGYFVTAVSDNMDAFLADPELEGAPIVELNDIKLVTLSKKSSADAAARAKIQVFKWTGGNVYPYSSNWNPAELDDDATDVVYITIKSYRPVGNHSITSMDELTAIVNTYTHLTGKTLELYGIREGATIPKGWKSLAQVAKEHAEQLSKGKRFADTRKYQSVQGYMCPLLMNMKQAGLLGNGDLAAYMTEYAAATAKEPTLDDQNHVNQVRNFCQKLGVILTDTADDMATKYNALFKKYRMLNVYGKAFSNDWNSLKISDYKTEVADYIASIDALSAE